MEDMEHAGKKAKVRLFELILLAGLILVSRQAFGAVISKLPVEGKIVALTFDACETRTPSYFDEKILAFLLKEKIPFTTFVTGRFAKRNTERLAEISRMDFVGVENHSLNHIEHMEKLKPEEIKQELLENEALLKKITLKQTKFFRFPGGNYDQKTLKLVEGTGYRVVHWSFASGDPDRNIPKDRLYAWIMSKTKPGSILIFHINGRGYRTGEILPRIVQELRQKGYRFVKLEDVVH